MLLDLDIPKYACYPRAKIWLLTTLQSVRVQQPEEDLNSLVTKFGYWLGIKQSHGLEKVYVSTKLVFKKLKKSTHFPSL